MKSKLILAIALGLSLSSQAQPYKNIESNNIRIDPQWVKTMQSGDFCWAMDIAVDSKLNSYSTGYYRKTLSDSNFTVPHTCRSRHCDDELFLTKRDSSGDLKWLVYATGHIRPTRVLVEAEGTLLLTGFLMGDTMKMTQADGNVYTMLRGPKSGIYLIRLSTAGQVLKSRFLSETDEQVNDMVLDRQGNIYLAGVEQFRRAHKPGYVQRRLMVMKLDKNWKTVWRYLADTMGNSSGNALTLSGSNLVVGGSLTDTFSFAQKLITHKGGSQRALVFALNKKGKVKWMIDSIGRAHNYVVNGLASDSKGDVYIYAGSSSSYAALAKVSSKGKLKWSQNINGRATVYTNRLLVNAKDEIYLCGEGYGAVFQSTKPELLSYKSFGSTDPFIASYATDGSLRWLKVFGGKATDYCKSIALNGEHLHAFGWTNQPFRFYSMLTPGKRGYLFYEAKFELQKLEEWNTSANKPFVEVKEKWPKVNASDCGCETAPNKKIGYAGSISSLAELSDFKNAIDWTMEPHDSLYKYLFYTGLQNSSSRQSAFYSFNLISFRPIQLSNPSKAYILELNPCSNQARHRMSSASVSVDYALNGRAYDFNMANIDSSADSYFAGLYALMQADDEEWLSAVLFNNSLKKYRDNRAQIKEMYGILLDSLGEEEEIVASLSQALDERDISVARFACEFLITGKSAQKHKVTTSEIALIEQFIYGIGYRGSFNDLNHALHPSYRFSMYKTQVGIRFEPKLLHQWNSVQAGPSLDSLGKPVPAYALVEADEFEFTTRKGVDLKFSSSCFKRSEIGNTGVLLDASKFRLIDPKAEQRGLSAYDYPLSVDSSSLYPIRSHRMPKLNLELQNFEGVLFYESSCQVPVEGSYLSAKGYNIAINGQLITGRLDLEVYALDTMEDGQVRFTMSLNSDPVSFTEATLRDHMLSLGFQAVQVSYSDYLKKLSVHFIYRKAD